MSGIAQISTDLKKFIDSTFYAYNAKMATTRQRLRTLYSVEEVDPSQITNEYTQMTQSYSTARGYEGFAAGPQQLADGATPQLNSFGTQDNTSTQQSFGRAFLMDRKLLSSSLPFQKAYVARHALEIINVIENDVNVTLNTNLAANAAQTFSAGNGTWATTGDPVADINNAKNAFIKRSGGLPADSIAINPDSVTQLENDFRFQNKLYTTEGGVLDKGTITGHPMGLDWVVDTAVTSGTFFMCKKGMFGKLLVSENMKNFQVDLGSAGQRTEAVFSYVDQYELPYYLMYGSGI